MKNELKVVTTFIIRGHEWLIVHNSETFEGDTEDRHYTGIKREWITDHKLNRKLNGVEAKLSKTVAEVIDRITDAEEIDYLIESEGLDTTEACLVYFRKKYNLA